MNALAVFHNHGVGFLQRFLKTGFRHVFVAVLVGECWVSIDGRAGVPFVDIVANADFDLAKFYRNEGFTVIETVQRKVPPVSPFAIANCVGMAKTILSIRSTAVTPWRLYKYLRKNP